MSNYLISPGFDTESLDRQLCFGFNNNPSAYNFFEKIYVYNTKGFKIPFVNFKHSEHQINIFKYIQKKDFLLYFFSFLFFYISNLTKLNITLLESLFFYVGYKKIIAKNRGVIFKVSELNDNDFIFNYIIRKSQSKAVYFLHTMKPLTNDDLSFIKRAFEDESTVFIVPSKYHLCKIKDYVNEDKIFLSNYNSILRVSQERKVVYNYKAPYLVLLNGDQSDELFIDKVTERFGLDIVLRPHPTSFFVYGYPIQAPHMLKFKGVIYNKSSSILRLEWIDLPKFFVSVSSKDVDILGDLRTKTHNIETGVIGKKYILENFHHLESNEKFWSNLNENFNIK